MIRTLNKNEFIEFTDTEAEAIAILNEFEDTDKADGTYEDNFYEVAKIEWIK